MKKILTKLIFSILAAASIVVYTPVLSYAATTSAQITTMFTANSIIAKTGTSYAKGTNIGAGTYLHLNFPTPIAKGTQFRVAFNLTDATTNYPMSYTVYGLDASGSYYNLTTGTINYGGTTIDEYYSSLGAPANADIVAVVLSPNVTYSVSNSSHTGDISYEGTFSGTPLPPANLTASNISPTSADLSWSPSTYATDYFIYFGGVKVGSVTSTSYHITGLTPGTLNGVYVSAYNANYSVESPRSAVNINTPYPIPTKVTGLAASTITYQSVSLSWDSVQYAQSYNIYSGNTKIGNASSTTYTVSASPLTSYTFYVTAVDSSGEGPMSASVSVKTPDRPVTPSPTDVKSSGTPGGNGSITWTPGADTPAGTVYTVYKSGVVIGTTTDTSFPLSNYNPNYPYSVSAQATGWKPSAMISDSPFGLIRAGWGINATDLLNNSIALIASLGGLLLLIVVLVFGPTLASYVRAVFRNKGDKELSVYNPVQYTPDRNYTESYKGYQNVTTDPVTDVETHMHPRERKQSFDYSTAPSSVETSVNTDVSTRATTQTTTNVSSDIGTYKLDY